MNTLRYLWPKTPYIKMGDNSSAPSGPPESRWPHSTPWSIYNNDGSISPVLHQFDSEKWMLQALDRAAGGYIREQFPEASYKP